MATKDLVQRWQLFRLLGEPARLRVLALAAREELSLGELADLLGEPLPNISRHAAPLRKALLLSERRLGTRTYVRLAERDTKDALIGDALAVGRALCEEDGSFSRIGEVVRRRDARTREFLGVSVDEHLGWTLPNELPFYLGALRELVPARDLALDACPRDGALLEVLCPIFTRVVALESSPGAAVRARRRAAARGYTNLEFVQAGPDDAPLRERLGAGADLVVAAYVGESPVERASAASLLRLLGPRGRLVVLEADRRIEWRSGSTAASSEGLDQLGMDALPPGGAREVWSDWRVFSGVRGRTSRESPRS